MTRKSWPEGWKWNGRLTKNWMKNFVVTTVNGYAYQPIYSERHGDWENHMSKIRKEQVKLSWFANFKQAIRMPSFMIDEMKGGPVHVFYLLMRTFRTFRKFPAIKKWEKQQLPDYLAVIERWQQIDPTRATGEELLTGMESHSILQKPCTGMPYARLSVLPR